MTTNQIERCLDLESKESQKPKSQPYYIISNLSEETLTELLNMKPGKIIRVKKGERIEYL